MGQDLSDGKFTLPFIMVYNKASLKERKYLHRLISDSSAENLGIVYDYIKKYKGVKLAERELIIINSEAEKILKSFKASRHRELLGKLLEYNYLRKR